MCGITGYLDWRGIEADDPTIIKTMTATLALRGPDGQGIWRDTTAALGHTRLAIIDVAGGAQPMKLVGRHGQKIVLVYSGEIYNFLELRHELRRLGRRFDTESDTEVLLQAYDEWGVACVEKLNGMYAFAVWDAGQDELVLVRDRLGIKPLYFYRTPHGVVFGSEPKALLAHPAVPAEVDETGLNELFAMVPMATPGTAVLRGLAEVRPGHLVRFTRDGRVDERLYWCLESRPHEADGVATVAHVAWLLRDIIGRQAVADRPVGALIAGVDSSAAAAGLAQLRAECDQRIHTYTIDYDGHASYSSSSFHVDSDAPWARLVAQHIGSIHTEVVVTTDELLAAMDDSLRAMDLPSLPHLNDSLLLLFRRIAQDCPVVLSGEGADEVFRGYRWHYDPALSGAGGFPWHTTYPPVLELLSDEARHQLRPAHYLAARYREALETVPYLPGETGLDRRGREVAYLTITHYLRFLLNRKDRASMAAGVEGRVPYLDHRLVQYVWNVPWDVLRTGGEPKGLLRTAVAHLLPHDVTWRAKSGYPPAQTPGYQRALWALMRDILADNTAPIHAFIHAGRVKDLLDRAEGDLSSWNSFLHVGYLVSVNKWLEAYNVRVR